MASSSEGSREIDAAKKRLAAAKARASADTDALESAKGATKMAKKMMQMAEKNQVDAKSRLQNSTKEVKEAETFLKEAEARWEVVAIDDSDADESEEGGSRKKQKKSDDIDEIVVAGCGIPGANGIYKLSSEKKNNHLLFEKAGEWKGRAGEFIIWRYTLTGIFWFVGFQGETGRPKNLYYRRTYADFPPKSGWMAEDSEDNPAPNLKW